MQARSNKAATGLCVSAVAPPAFTVFGRRAQANSHADEAPRAGSVPCPLEVWVAPKTASSVRSRQGADRFGRGWTLHSGGTQP